MKLSESIRRVPGSVRERVWAARAEKLESDNAAMREALEWYGDKENWGIPPLVAYDNGQRARDVIEEVGK